MTNLLAILNRERVARQKSPLQPDPQLSAAAQTHSADMSAHHNLTHNGSDGSYFITRFDSVGYPHLYAGEIIAWDTRMSEESVVQLWINSPPHFAIMFSDNYTQFGAGQEGGYWTVDFGSRRV